MGLFGISNVLLVVVSFVLIIISIVAIAICILFVLRKKTPEEKHADKVLSSLALLKEGKKLPSSIEPVIKSTEKTSSKQVPGLEIKKEENSLKHLLIKKFKPIVEKQLGAKAEFLDFNAKDENFLALVIISGVKILLTLDSSGKILDYKKVKQKE